MSLTDKSQPIVPDYDEVWENVYGDIQAEGPVHRHLHRIVSKMLAGLDYKSVLDIGCGPGHNYQLLSEGHKLEEFAGTDISGVTIERAKKAVDGQFWQSDIEQSHVDQQWELVHCSLVLEHLPNDEAALSNMRKMTSKYLLATTIAGDFERYRNWDEMMGHVRNYKRGELEQKLVKAGFKVRKSIYWGFPFYNPLVRTMQNYSKAGTGQFNKTTQLIAKILYWLYYLNSSRRGDLLIILAEV